MIQWLEIINAGWQSDANQRFLCRNVNRMVHFSIIRVVYLGLLFGTNLDENEMFGIRIIKNLVKIEWI